MTIDDAIVDARLKLKRLGQEAHRLRLARAAKDNGMWIAGYDRLEMPPMDWRAVKRYRGFALRHWLAQLNAAKQLH